MIDKIMLFCIPMFEPGSGGIWKNCRDSIGPDVAAKSRFSVSDGVFAIDGIKQRKHLENIAVCDWCECGWVKLIKKSNQIFIILAVLRRSV